MRKTKIHPCGEYGLVREKDINQMIIVIENHNCDQCYEEEECTAMKENLWKGGSVGSGKDGRFSEGSDCWAEVTSEERQKEHSRQKE